MKRSELVKKLSLLMNVTKKEAELYFDAFLDSIMMNLCVDSRVVFNGFGSFKVKEFKARVMKSPITGELMKLPIRRKIIFRPGKELRERVNTKKLYETETDTNINHGQVSDNVLSISAG
jgi:integration host factor subunit beta